LFEHCFILRGSAAICGCYPVMENGEAVDQAAREAIDQHGGNAVSILRERAEVSDHLGDELSARRGAILPTLPSGFSRLKGSRFAVLDAPPVIGARPA
jgi:hypothetical protein